jgi:hypothetical protein
MVVEVFTQRRAMFTVLGFLCWYLSLVEASLSDGISDHKITAGKCQAEVLTIDDWSVWQCNKDLCAAY